MLVFAMFFLLWKAELGSFRERFFSELPRQGHSYPHYIVFCIFKEPCLCFNFALYFHPNFTSCGSPLFLMVYILSCTLLEA